LSHADLAAVSDRCDPIWIRYPFSGSGLDAICDNFGAAAVGPSLSEGFGEADCFGGVGGFDKRCRGRVVFDLTLKAFTSEGTGLFGVRSPLGLAFFAGILDRGVSKAEVGGAFGTSNFGAGTGGGLRAIGTGNSFSGGGNSRSVLRPSVELSILP